MQCVLNGEAMTCVMHVIISHLILLLGAVGKALPWSVSSCPPGYEGMLCLCVIQPEYCICWLISDEKKQYRKAKAANLQTVWPLNM